MPKTKRRRKTRRAKSETAREDATGPRRIRRRKKNERRFPRASWNKEKRRDRTHHQLFRDSFRRHLRLSLVFYFCYKCFLRLVEWFLFFEMMTNDETNAKPSAKPLSSPPNNAALLGVFARSKPLSLRRWDVRSPVAFASGGKVVFFIRVYYYYDDSLSFLYRGVRCLFTLCGSQFLFSLWRQKDETKKRLKIVLFFVRDWSLFVLKKRQKIRRLWRE